MVAAAFALRMVGLPALQLWHTLLPHKQPVLVHEDNQATIDIIVSGKNPTLRHLNRTHRVNVAWLHEQYREQAYLLTKIPTGDQCGDIFTKAITDKVAFRRALQMIGHIHVI